MKWEYRILLQFSKGEIQGSFTKKVMISIEPKGRISIVQIKSHGGEVQIPRGFSVNDTLLLTMLSALLMFSTYKQDA